MSENITTESVITTEEDDNKSATPSSSTAPPVVLATFSGDTNDNINSSNTNLATVTSLSEQASAKANTKKIDLIKIPDFIRNNWDPLNSADWEMEKPTQNCLHRIKKDIYSLYQDPAPGICVIPDENDITKIYALITGPFDTPYEGGFFSFLIRCPPNYPFSPPRVRLMTTSNGTVRFNPNLYKNGKVCLSILGTWEGPAWLPSQSLSSILMSIQSLMNTNPYFNEPGHETERQLNASKYYNDIIKYDTIRVAVCENLENEKFEPKLFRNVMESSFIEYYDYYAETCKMNLEKDSEPMRDLLFNEKRGNFKYGELLKRLECIKKKINIEKLNESDEKNSQLEDEDESKSEEEEEEAKISSIV